MEELFIQYQIENKYEIPVRKANFQLLLIPESSPQQQVLDLNFKSTLNREMYLSKNIFGFNTINFYIDQPFTSFSFNLSARIKIPDINPFQISPLHFQDEFELISSFDFKIDNHLFLSPTVLTELPFQNEIQFPAYSGNKQIFEYLLELNTFIFNLLIYSPESTDVDTQISEVLKIRKGVCQDFAHLFLSVCRQNKIPARYVSGYLDQGSTLSGSSQLHAWIEALVPGLGWVGFDSTNNLLVDKHYIKIAHGTDYRDCSPIVGVLESTGKQSSIHSVYVSNQ